MAGRRRMRSDLPRDPAAAVRALRICRDAMKSIGAHVQIGGPIYVAAEGVTKAIDAMAYLLTGDREYFWGVGGGAPDGQRVKIAEQAVRERGDEPW